MYNIGFIKLYTKTLSPELTLQSTAEHLLSLTEDPAPQKHPTLQIILS